MAAGLEMYIEGSSSAHGCKVTAWGWMRSTEVWVQQRRGFRTEPWVVTGLGNEEEPAKETGSSGPER